MDGRERATTSGSHPADPVAPTADAERFRELYPVLRRLAAVAAPSDLDPDDLLQEAVTRVLARGGLADLDHPLAYLRQVIVHVASNHNRSRGRERRALGRVAGADRESVDGRGEAYPSDLADLDLLDPADRTAVYLADVERLPVADVASAIGASALATRARLSRARRKVREAISAMEATEVGGPDVERPTTGGGDR